MLTDVTPDMRAYREELFGPAAVVYRVADAEEAVALANDSAFGLGGVVWSADTEKAQQVADRLDTGMVWINSAQGSLRRPAVRRDQALRRRPRARALRHRRVRQQEADLHPRGSLVPTIGYVGRQPAVTAPARRHHSWRPWNSRDDGHRAGEETTHAISGRPVEADLARAVGGGEATAPGAAAEPMAGAGRARSATSGATPGVTLAVRQTCVRTGPWHRV